MLTVLVDYESGNLHSAQKAFERMAAEVGEGEVRVVNRPEEVLAADRIVLPGDGAFPACKRELAAIPGMIALSRQLPCFANMMQSTTRLRARATMPRWRAMRWRR